jgi:adenosine deaminase
MAVGLLCIIQRILPVRDAESVTDFAIQHRDTFVGLDLADNEVGFDSKPFSPFFHRAREAGLGITVHSGEADVPKAPRYVRDAIDFLGATRIGHGVQIHRDPEMIEYVRSQGVVLELCPTSNRLTNAIPELRNHPLKKLMQAGVRVTINTDDPGIFNIDLNHEFAICQSTLGMSRQELEACVEQAARASFLPLKKRQAVWPRPLA